MLHADILFSYHLWYHCCVKARTIYLDIHLMIPNAEQKNCKMNVEKKIFSMRINKNGIVAVRIREQDDFSIVSENSGSEKKIIYPNHVLQGTSRELMIEVVTRRRRYVQY